MSQLPPGGIPDGPVVVVSQAGVSGPAGLAQVAEERLRPFGPDEPVTGVVGGLWAAGGVPHPDQWPSAVGVPASLRQSAREGSVNQQKFRRANVRGLGALGQQVQHVPVTALGPGRQRCGRFELLVDAGLLHLPGQCDGVRAQGGDQVEGGGEHRLRDLVLDRLGPVLGPATGLLGDRRGGGAAPGPQICGNTVDAEQFGVADQVDGDLGGRAPGAWAVPADHRAVFVANVAAVGQVCLADLGVNLLQAWDAAFAEPCALHDLP
ncbi:hypothetical protein ACWCY1_26210 [Streptomyces goshikiensis]